MWLFVETFHGFIDGFSTVVALNIIDTNEFHSGSTGAARNEQTILPCPQPMKTGTGHPFKIKPESTRDSLSEFISWKSHFFLCSLSFKLFSVLFVYFCVCCECCECGPQDDQLLVQMSDNEFPSVNRRELDGMNLMSEVEPRLVGRGML